MNAFLTRGKARHTISGLLGGGRGDPDPRRRGGSMAAPGRNAIIPGIMRIMKPAAASAEPGAEPEGRERNTEKAKNEPTASSQE